MRLLIIFLLLMRLASADTHHLLLGPYTREGSHGLYAVQLDSATGLLTTPVLAAEARNPSWIAAHPSGRFVYAVDEIGRNLPDGKPAGAVTAFAVDAATGALTRLNSQPYAEGFGTPCHLAVDVTGRMLVAANYGGGNIAAFPLAADGTLGARSAFFQHAGKLGPLAARQDKPHAHSVTLSPDNRLAFVCDLGLDRIFAYRLDPATAALTPHEPASFAVAPGTGPRHSKFSPDGKFFYVLGELDASVTAFVYDTARGTLASVQRTAALPPDFHGENTAAEIRVSPDGRFLYTSNRGHDSLAVFARDAAHGTLTLIEIVPCGGKIPRNFALSPDGLWLVCAHQGSGSLAVFRVDAATGRLTLIPGAAAAAKVSLAVCVLFLD